MKSSECMYLFFGIGLFMASGCTSIVVRGMSDGQVGYYPGAREDGRMIALPFEATNTSASEKAEITATVIYGTIDFIPSAVVDTLVFPFDTTQQKRNPQPNKSLQPTATVPPVSTNK